MHLSARTIKFILSLGLLVGLFVSAFFGALTVLNAERQLLLTERAFGGVEYTLEVITRTVRQAEPGSLTLITPPGCRLGSCLRFIVPGQGVVEYKYCDAVTPACPVARTVLQTVKGVTTPLTPSNFRIRGLDFRVASNREHKEQPRVTVLLSLPGQPAVYAAMEVQTTVTLRSIPPSL